jgi:GntR family transcriptional regulator
VTLSFRMRWTPAWSTRRLNLAVTVLGGPPLARIREEVSARMPEPEETRLLHLPPGVPVLDVWHTSIDEKGEPYELTRFVMRGDMTALLYDVPVE